MRDVHAEAVGPALHPETQNAFEQFVNLGVFPVPIGLRRIEDVEVPLAGLAVGLRDASPGAAVENRLPVVRRKFAVFALAVAEHVHIAFGRAGLCRKGHLEQLVLIARVVRNDVDDHFDAELVCAGDEVVGVADRAETWINVGVVRNVVAAVLLRGRVERGEPQRIDAQVLEVVELGGDAGQVAHAVTVCVSERARIHLINNGVAPPFVGHVEILLGLYGVPTRCGREQLGRLSGRE